MIIKITFRVLKNSYSGGMTINSIYRVLFSILEGIMVLCLNKNIIFQNGSNPLIDINFNFSQIIFDTHYHTNVKNLRLIQTNVN